MLPGEVPYLLFSILAKYIGGCEIGSNENVVRNSSMRGRSTTRRRIGEEQGWRLHEALGIRNQRNGSPAYVSTYHWGVRWRAGDLLAAESFRVLEGTGLEGVVRGYLNAEPARLKLV